MGDVVKVPCRPIRNCKNARTLFSNAKAAFDEAQKEKNENPAHAADTFLSAGHGFYESMHCGISLSDAELSFFKISFRFAREIYFTLLGSGMTPAGHIWSAVIDSILEPERAVYNVREDLEKLKYVFEKHAKPADVGSMVAVYLLLRCEQEFGVSNYYLSGVLSNYIGEFHPSIDVVISAKTAAGEIFLESQRGRLVPYEAEAASSFYAAAELCTGRKRKLSLYLRTLSHLLDSRADVVELREKVCKALVTLLTQKQPLQTVLKLLADGHFLHNTSDQRIKAHLCTHAALMSDSDLRLTYLIRAIDIFEQSLDHIHLSRTYLLIAEYADPNTRSFCISKAISSLERSNSLASTLELSALRQRISQEMTFRSV